MTELLVKCFVKNREETDNPAVREQYGVLGGAVGIGCNLFLFLIKLLAGILTGAIAVIADAFNNLSDAGSSIVTLIGFKMAGKPADTDHPFGHGRIEYISGLFVAVAIMLVGVELARSSFEKILHPEEVTFSAVSIGILVLAIVVKLWMSAFNKKLGNRINSAAMKATAQDSFNDSIATGAVLLCMGFTYLTHINIDGYAGILVALFILYSGIGVAKDTLQPLLGQAPDPEFVKAIEAEILTHPEIVGVHDVIVHDYGPGRVMVSLHAEIPYDMDILVAHDVIDDTECEIKEKFKCEITIHMDPIVTNDEVTNAKKEEVKAIVKKLDEKMSIHDFRMTKGPLRTNLIFDLVIPYDCAIVPEEAEESIKAEIAKLDGTCYVVISIDRGYV